MRISKRLSDEAVLRELGARLARRRLARDMTQARLAEEAGIAKRTLERLEAGEGAARLSVFVRVCRVLDLIAGLDGLVPPPAPGPVEQLQRAGRGRQRASGRRAAEAKPRKWTWGDEP